MASREQILRVGKAISRRTQESDMSWTYGRFITGSGPQTGLPRDVNEFLSGAFGPLAPINPYPVDAVQDNEPRQGPRRWQYPVGFNVPSFPGSIKLIPFGDLLQAADLYSVARACIRNRVLEITSLEYDIVPNKELAKYVATSRTYRKEYEERREKILKWFRRPDPNYTSFDNWLYALLDQMFTIDAMSLYVHPTQRPGKGLFGSSLDSLDVIDGSCYTEDTEVLTELRGWVRFQDLNDNDLVATRHPITHTFEWQRPTYFHREIWDGEVVHLHSKAVDLLVTPNHRVLTLTDHGIEHIARAESLPERISIPTDSIWNAQTRFEVPTEISHLFSGPEGPFNFVRFMGMYLAEGYVHGSSKRISISQMKKSKGHSEFKELLTNIFGAEPAHDGSQWRFTNTALGTYLEQFGKSHDKHIPQIIRNADVILLAEFLHFYLLGDGWHNKTTERCTTVSRQLAGDLQEICQKLGTNAVVRERPARTPLSRPQFELCIRADDDVLAHVSRKHYAGMVYCVSVPNEVLYVRRNGRAVWCGNTIYPLVDITGGSPEPPNPAYQQYLYGVPRTDLMNLPTEADLADFGFQRNYRASQLLYLPRFKRANTPYGYSNLEQVFVPVTIGMKRQEWRLDYFQLGNVPNTFIVAPPEYSPAQALKLQDALNQYQGNEYKWKSIVLPGNSNPIEQKLGAIASEQDVTVYLEVLMGFDMIPKELGASGHSGEGNETSTSGQRQRDIKKVDRIRSTTQWLTESLFNHILHNVFHQHDLLWHFDLGEEEERQRLLAQTHKMYVDTGILARDEVRKDLGKDPFGYEMTEKPTLSGFPPAPLWDEGGEPVPTQGPNPYNGKPNSPTFGSQSPTPPTGESTESNKPPTPQAPLARFAVPLITKKKPTKESGHWQALPNGKRVFVSSGGRLLLHPNHSELTPRHAELAEGSPVKVNDKKHRQETHTFVGHEDDRTALVADSTGGQWRVASSAVVPGERTLPPDSFYYVHPDELTTADRGAAVSFTEASPYYGYTGQLTRVNQDGRTVQTTATGDARVPRAHLLDVVHGHTEDGFRTWNAQWAQIIQPQLQPYSGPRSTLPQGSTVYHTADPRELHTLLGDTSDGKTLLQSPDGEITEHNSPDLGNGSGKERIFALRAEKTLAVLEKLFGAWKPSTSAREVVTEYTEPYFSDTIQKPLRLGIDVPDMALDLDRAIASAPPLPLSIMVHRGVTQEASDYLGLSKDTIEGMVYQDDGFTSASVDHMFTTPAQLHITIPAGAHIFPVWSVGDNEFGEVLLPRHSVFRISKKEKEVLPTGNTLHLYVDWLGQRAS